MKKTFTAHQIREAFRKVREDQADMTDLTHATGENYSIFDVEKMLFEFLQPAAAPSRKVGKIDLSQLKTASLDEFNEALF